MFSMRRLLHRHRWATLSVVVLLLFATSGMAISRMTCLISGHSIVALGMLEDRCPDPAPAEGATVAPVCCVFGQAAANVEPFMPGVGLEFVPLAVSDGWANVPQRAALRPASPDQDFARPPPLASAHRLVLHSTFRI